MNFKKLEIYGFKSFADKLEIKFDDGITAIVGPNGCGKSNVADALRWVMGEQSAKTLRGSSMSDLIFSGTEKRKSLSYCEVSLHFDNSNRIFPVDFNEIVVSRKLYRDGTSEYLLNRNTCRLKDISDLLRDSGLGRDGYSVIGQGKIDEILSAKPDDRRAVFEEAAGVSRFKVRKVEAERKLARTRDNIDRLTDIILELERQLEPLAKQAENARKYLELKERLKHFEVNTYIYQYESASEAKQLVKNKLDGIYQEIERKTLDCNDAADQYNQSMTSLNSLDKNIDDLREELMTLTVDIEKQRGELKLLNEKLGYLKEQNLRLAGEIQKLNTDFSQSTAELNYCNDKKAEKLDAAQETKRKIEALSDKYFKIIDDLTVGEGEAEENNTLVINAMDKLSDIKANMSRLLAERTALDDKIAELQKRIGMLKTRAADDGIKAILIGNETDKMKSGIDVLSKRSNELTSTHNEALMRVQSLAVEIDKLSAQYHTKTAHHKFISQLQSNFDGYQASVKQLLKDAQTNNELSSKIEGVIAHIIKVPEKYETAVETALGTALQNIVTKTDIDAKFLIEYLKERRYGRITFQPMNTVRPRHLDDRHLSKLKRKGCFGVAPELMEFDQKYANILWGLLGTTVIVDTIDDAIHLARDTGYEFKIVTLDGDITQPGGAITGGSKKADINNLLAHERELTKLSVELEQQKKLLDDKIALRSAAANAQKSSADELKKISEEIHSRQLVLATKKEAQSKINASIEEATKEATLLEQEESTAQRRLDEINNDLNNVEKYENIIKSEKDNASVNRAERQKQFDQLRKTREELHERITHEKVNLASIEAEVSAINSDIERLKQHTLDICASIETNNEQISNNNETIKAAEEGIKDYESRVDSSGNERALQIRDSLSNLDKYKQKLQDEITKFDAQRLSLINLLSKLNDDKAREEYLLEKVDSDILAMQERIEDEYNLTYEKCLEYKDENYDLNSGISEANRLKRQIQHLGYVNVNAIEESKAVGERYYEKVSQRDDLAKAESDLLKIIDELTKEMLVRFNTEFNKIAENFVKIFRELFGGGNAKLMLIDSENPLEAGIEIVAEPPGKKLQSISLLSGGERALTAIAILFSILRLRPMPFCVLDEIEAALDDANAERFAKYLHRFSENTQFIVITHRKPTMELADNLYGVTMEEKGISKIVSVKLSEAVKTAEKAEA